MPGSRIRQAFSLQPVHIDPGGGLAHLHPGTVAGIAGRPQSRRCPARARSRHGLHRRSHGRFRCAGSAAPPLARHFPGHVHGTDEVLPAGLSRSDRAKPHSRHRRPGPGQAAERPVADLRLLQEDPRRPGVLDSDRGIHNRPFRGRFQPRPVPGVPEKTVSGSKKSRHGKPMQGTTGITGDRLGEEE